METTTPIPGGLNFTISKTWDGGVPSDHSEIHIKLTLQGEEDAQTLLIQVDAPFFNDPQPPASLSPPGSTPQLWDYEVVELFFLGDEDKYLEVELGPRGHYLVLQLHGVRNIIREHLPLDRYVTEVRGTRWFGEASVPLAYFPHNVHSTNMYAIHKSDPHRVYMALSPAVDNSKCPHSSPDFHRLQYFQHIDLFPRLCKGDEAVG
ncbi:UPF0462 protein C4orf33 homolog isoform X2 [Folsomia candida]|uniref:Uncharacterized protein n=2 Tax=Folsomia candida TaxID=158441 RepID=A0A226D9A0_FOLCA|nr:UPF0462 protein C4orf33 homolog isoform X2 [Folsomia candida]XP_021964549.1 UPF0462 protein C4orf33 homolog isoform X2 [Folsomia candida]XP_021964550.1 UPF0462 protein C4orf33 homolog isoform X2 [Folsomia candida]XP_021964552.1 UPF0462 protein C4orf33 homolog isoform X2 [Folsomia candida]OXA41789.1 hypothetical protein Fcan01_23581 [Folsomia candida]